jgi:hypothetical protein
MKTRTFGLTTTFLLWAGVLIVLALLMMLAAPRLAGASVGIDARAQHATQAELLPGTCPSAADVGVDHACLGHAANSHCYVADAMALGASPSRPGVSDPARDSVAGAHVPVDIPPPKATLSP